MFHLVRFEATDWKGIEAQEIVPRGRSAVVEGANGTGKTSLADALYCWFTGGSLAEFIRNGADKAELEGELIGPGGSLRVKRVIRKKGGAKLEIKGPDGKAPEMGASELLDRIVGSGIALRPMKLFKMSEDQQRDAILACLNVSVADEEAAEKAAYDQRTEANREKKAAEGRLEALLTRGAALAPEKALDKADVLARVKAAEARAVAESRRVEAVQRAATEVEKAKADFDVAMKALDAAIAQESAVAKIDVDAGAAAELETARGALASLGEHNTKAALRADYVKAKAEVKALDEKSAQLSAAVDAARAKKGTKLTEAAQKSGFPDLQFGEIGCTLGGVHLNDLNFAAQLEFGVGIGLPARKEGSLMLAIIDSAAELDDESTVRVEAWARKLDVQLIFFKVKSGQRELSIEVLEPEDAGA